MRTSFASLILITSSAFATPVPSSAQNAVSRYPWCYEANRPAPIFDCYYSSYNSCLLQARPRGGFCVQNPGYRPLAPPLRGRRPPRS